MLQLLFAFPDLPAPKATKPALLRDVVVNDGWHTHAIVLTPTRSRMTESLDQHIEKNQNLNRGSHGKAQRVHVIPVEPGPADEVVDYAMKALKRGHITSDDLLLLPRCESEL